MSGIGERFALAVVPVFVAWFADLVIAKDPAEPVSFGAGQRGGDQCS
jgi:hypothetical protein